MTITVQHTEECLCAAHIVALAGVAGVGLGHHIHDYGVDGSLEPVVMRNKRRVTSGFGLQFQAKATTTWELRDGNIVYDLESKNYNDIVKRSPAETTLILILLCLPKEATEWHVSNLDATTLRTCCFYHLPRGEPVENENSTKRIFIPTEQLLTPQSLNELLAAERKRREAQIA